MSELTNVWPEHRHRLLRLECERVGANGAVEASVEAVAMLTWKRPELG
jgi:hypothetical protein